MIKIHNLIGWNFLELRSSLTALKSIAKLGKKRLGWMEVRTLWWNYML